MNRTFITVVLVAALAGCSTMTPARYAPSADNQVALRGIPGISANVAEVTSSVNYSANCRLMGPIQASDGMTIPQFVQKAINDELKMAGLHSMQGMALTGRLTEVSFSSTTGLTNGRWNLAMTLTSSNGKHITSDVAYDFKSGFDAVTACNQTAQALGPAVQDLIRALITHPQFPALVETN